VRAELNKVLKLQSQIESVEKAITEAKESIVSAGATPDSLRLLRGLHDTHSMLSTQAEALYTSLNLVETYPELEGLPSPFAHTLVALRELKVDIQEKAAEAFQELEALDQAVAGKREPQGMRCVGGFFVSFANSILQALNSIRALERPCLNIQCI
jgi:hypothetical protein